MLFIVKMDVAGGTPLNPDRVFTDLFWITDQDYGLGAEEEVYVNLVTYARSQINPFSDVVQELVASSASVSIAGLSTSQGAPTGVQITTYNNDGSIYIVYDAEACGFQGLYTYDDNGQKICTPPPVALFHELIHAYRYLTAQWNPDKQQEEQQAIASENALRVDRGLPLRGINSWSTPGGCGAANCGTATGTGTTISCFVVKASLGDDYESVVSSMRADRNVWAAKDKRFADLLLQFYPEYYAIGLPLIRTLGQKPHHLRVVRELLVEPYLFLWRAMYRLSPLHSSNIGPALDDLFSALGVSLMPSRPAIHALLAEAYTGNSNTACVNSLQPPLQIIESCLASQSWKSFPVFRWAVLGLLKLVYSPCAANLALQKKDDNLLARTALQEFRLAAMSWAESSPSAEGKELGVSIWQGLAA